MTSEANWQAQSNEQQEWDYDHDLHTAWCKVAMGLATDYAEAYCNHQCDDSQDHLPELGRTRRELKQHLFNQPASMGPAPDVNELRMWAEDLHSRNGHTPIAAALSRVADEIVMLRSDPGTEYAHRLAIMLECALLDQTGVWNQAHELLHEYNEAVRKYNEAHGQPYVSGFGKD